MAKAEDLDLVRRIHAAMQAGNMIGMLELVHRDVEWVQPMGMPGASLYRGHDGIRQQANSWAGTWDEHTLDPLDFEEIGDKCWSTAASAPGGAPAAWRWRPTCTRSGRSRRAGPSGS